MKFLKLFRRCFQKLLCRHRLSDQISKQSLPDEALERIAIELERQVRNSGFDEKLDDAQFRQTLSSLIERQAWGTTPFEVEGFAYSRRNRSGNTEIVTVSFKSQARFRHVFIRVGEILPDGEAVHVDMAHLDEMVDGDWKARPVRKVLTAFNPDKIIDAAKNVQRNLNPARTPNIATLGS